MTFIAFCMLAFSLQKVFCILPRNLQYLEIIWTSDWKCKTVSLPEGKHSLLSEKHSGSMQHWLKERVCHTVVANTANRQQHTRVKTKLQYVLTKQTQTYQSSSIPVPFKPANTQRVSNFYHRHFMFNRPSFNHIILIHGIFGNQLCTIPHSTLLSYS